VNVTGISVAGPDAGNYVYKDAANTTANITPRNLHVHFTAQNKVYDGNIAATATPSTTGCRVTCSPSTAAPRMPTRMRAAPNP
jgi:hypothetical protein